MTTELVTKTVTTVNYHLWPSCNMGCGYCFATFHDVPLSPASKRPFLPHSDALQVVNLLGESEFRKINFAGGEPTLCPWLPDLIRQAKSHGLTTSIVTNGSKINAGWLDSLAGEIDIIALSIDSVNAEALKEIGRTVGNQPPMSSEKYREVAELIKERGIRLKVNTVVSHTNADEDFRPFVLSVQPERWKIFQVLPVVGQNDGRIDEFMISGNEFERYVRRNRTVEQAGIVVVPESNTLMTGSYAMVDPLGRFYDNTKGKHTYSRPILEVGVAVALQHVSILPGRFLERDGNYD